MSAMESMDIALYATKYVDKISDFDMHIFINDCV